MYFSFSFLFEFKFLSHGKTKHVEFRHHYIRDMVSQGEMILQHISTNSIVTDPLTKPIVRDLFFSHAKSMGLRRI